MNGARTWAVGNWFLLTAPMLLVVSFLFTRSVDWQRWGRTAEAVTLFDWMITVPALYFLCYRSTLSVKAMALRLIALACLGVWIASWLVPAAAQEVLPNLSWPRTVGLAALALIELRLLVLALKLAFSDRADAETLTQRTGAPPVLAKLMLLEARFWKAVWTLVRRR